MSYDDTLILLEEDNENEIFSPPFQPYSPTDSDIDKYSVHTSKFFSSSHISEDMVVYIYPQLFFRNPGATGTGPSDLYVILIWDRNTGPF